MNETKLNIIGVGGYARAGKDTFVKIASKILVAQGYTTKKFAFADGLKNDLDAWLTEKYGISAWTDKNEEKSLIRPILVAHGCGKRNQTQGKYWVDKIDEQLKSYVRRADGLSQKVVYFVSDVRFVNEAEWVHSLGGWVVHLKKFTTDKVYDGERVLNETRKYDFAPNDEELKNDPLLQAKSDYFLELEDVTTKSGNIITPEDIADDSYLNDEIALCLTKCPFLNIQV